MLQKLYKKNDKTPWIMSWRLIKGYVTAGRQPPELPCHDDYKKLLIDSVQFSLNHCSPNFVIAQLKTLTVLRVSHIQ